MPRTQGDLVCLTNTPLPASGHAGFHSGPSHRKALAHVLLSVLPAMDATWRAFSVLNHPILDANYSATIPS